MEDRWRVVCRGYSKNLEVNLSINPLNLTYSLHCIYTHLQILLSKILFPTALKNYSQILFLSLGYENPRE